MREPRHNVRGSLVLGITALIWGLAFVAQSDAAALIPPFLFNAVRSAIGSLFLLFLLLGRRLFKGVPPTPKPGGERKNTLLAGVLCGILLTACVNLQQFGLTVYPEGVAAAARGGFLTALYVILVPIFSAVGGKRASVAVWIAVGISAVGIYLLCLSGGISNVYLGDVLVFFCAVSFSLHILVIDRFGAGVDGIRLSAIQFAVCAVLSGILSVLTEEIRAQDIVNALPQILYLGILSSGVGYTLQIYGQRYTDPPIASLTMSLESVFAVLGDWIITGNLLTKRELLGCGLVFFAIVLAQLPQFFADRQRAG